MVHLIELFGVEEGNGLSLFATEINIPAELNDHLKAFFKPPKRDPRVIGSFHYDADEYDREV